MLGNLQILDGKFFIVFQPASDGERTGQRLFRGRILGQTHEIFPVYLCDIYPIDIGELQVRTQTLMTLEQLTAGWLYDDREIWDRIPGCTDGWSWRGRRLRKP